MGYDALVVAPHPDDAETQMGGTLAKLADRGQRLLIVDLTEGEPTELAAPGVRAAQAAEAARILGVDRLNLGLTDRLLADTQDVRLEVARLIRVHRPRWVYGIGEACVHPDHAAAVGLTVPPSSWPGWASGTASPVASGWPIRSRGRSSASSSRTARWSHPGASSPSRST